MSNLTDILRHLLGRFGRPHEAELPRATDEIVDAIDHRLTHVEREQSEIAARLQLLEYQANPRGASPMEAEFVLTGLLCIALVLAICLILLSSAMTGRKLADLEYQTESGINGVHRIQAWTNIRTHANRVFMGTTFVVITVLLLADAPMIWRTWINRVLFAVLMTSYVASSILDWRAERRQVRIIQQRIHDGRDQAFAAGVADAEGKAEARMDAAMALSNALPVHDAPVVSVSVGPAGPAGIQGPVGPQGQVGPAGVQGEPAPEREA